MADLVTPWAKTIGHVAALFALAWLIQGVRPTYQQVIGMIAISALVRTYTPAQENRDG